MPNENITLPEVEIFDVGTHNGIPFDLAAVKALFENTKKVIEQVKPYLGWHNVEAPHLGIGHRSKDGTPNIGDELAEKKRSDLPSLGWITKLWMNGTKILATFTDVPRSVGEAIRLGRYRRVSPDVEFNYRNPVTGERLPAVIKAVRLIGVTPAIKTLDDVLALGDESVTISLTEAGGTLEGITLKEEGIMPGPLENLVIKSPEDALKALVALIDATPAEIQKELGFDTMKQELLEEPKPPEKPEDDKEKPEDKPSTDPEVATLRADLKGKEKEIADLKKSHETLQGTVKGISDEKRKTEIKTSIDTLKSEGRLLPAEEPAVLALMEELPENAVIELAEGGKTTKVGGVQLVEKLFRTRPKVVEFGERARGGGNDEGNTVEAQYNAGRKIYDALGVTPTILAEFGEHGRKTLGGVLEFGEDPETLEVAKALVTLLRRAKG